MKSNYYLLNSNCLEVCWYSTSVDAPHCLTVFPLCWAPVCVTIVCCWQTAYTLMGFLKIQETQQRTRLLSASQSQLLTRVLISAQYYGTRYIYIFSLENCGVTPGIYPEEGSLVSPWAYLFFLVFRLSPLYSFSKLSKLSPYVLTLT